MIWSLVSTEIYYLRVKDDICHFLAWAFVIDTSNLAQCYVSQHYLYNLWLNTDLNNKTYQKTTFMFPFNFPWHCLPFSPVHCILSWHAGLLCAYSKCFRRKHTCFNSDFPSTLYTVHDMLECCVLTASVFIAGLYAAMWTAV